MPSCLDTDAVVTLARLADDPLELLRHALECERCREALAEVALLRREAGATVATRAGFTDELMQALPARGEPARDSSSGAAWAWRALQGSLTAAVAFFVAASAGAAMPGAMGPLVIMACALAAAAAVFGPRAFRAPASP